MQFVQHSMNWPAEKVAPPPPARIKSPTKTFSDAADAVTARLDKLRQQTKEAEGWKAAHKYGAIINRINSLKNHFGLMSVVDIKRKDIRTWLDSFSPKPAQTTVGNFAAVWTKVMQEAVVLGWIDEDDCLKISKKGFEASHARSAFSESDMRKLVAFMTPEWMTSKRSIMENEINRLIHAYIAVGATTGIRAGLEFERLLVRQVRIEADVMSISVEKQKVMATTALRPRRVAICQRDVFDMVPIIRNLVDGRRSDELLLARQAGRNVGSLPGFTNLLKDLFKKANVHIVFETGKSRSAYSLRHYYATPALTRQELVQDIAKEMGTSVQMIENHYGQVIAEVRHKNMAEKTTGGLNLKTPLQGL